MNNVHIFSTSFFSLTVNLILFNKSCKMFEGILEEINGFGYFQIINIFLLWTSRLVVPCHILLHNFIGVKPHHHCDISLMDDAGLFGNLTEEQKLTVLIPAGEDGKPKSCEMFSEPQFHLLCNSSNSEILPTVQCQSGWVYDNSTFSSTLVTEVQLTFTNTSCSCYTENLHFYNFYNMLHCLTFLFHKDLMLY